MVLQLGTLEDHGGIHVDDLEPSGFRQLSGVAEEDETVAAFPTRVGVGEMHSDIAQCGRAQNGIGDGVRQHVRVRVAFQSEFAGDGDSAQNQRAAGGDAVDVPTEPGANLTQAELSLARSSCRKACASTMSPGLVILIFRSLPGTTVTSTSRRSTRLDSSVPMKPSAHADWKARVS